MQGTTIFVTVALCAFFFTQELWLSVLPSGQQREREHMGRPATLQSLGVLLFYFKNEYETVYVDILLIFTCLEVTKSSSITFRPV